jgi:hypothetical protein
MLSPFSLRFKFLTTCLLFWIAGMAQYGHGQTVNNGGMDFLSISANARALGLAGTETAVLNGAASLFANPAAMAWEPKSSAQGNYTLWISDTRHSFAGGQFHPNNSTRQAWGVALYASSIDDIQARQQPGPSTGAFNVSYLALATGYAYRWKHVAVGGTAMYLNENYLANRASGWAINIGALASFLDQRIKLGAGLLNVGRMDPLITDRTPLPATVRTGLQVDIVEFTILNEPQWPILISFFGDLDIPFSGTDSDNIKDWQLENPESSIAIEIDIDKLIQLRTGYKFGSFNRRIHAGAGVHWEDIRFNYTLVPFETGYGTVHSLGVQYYFN